MKHITELYKPGTTQVCEIKQAKRLRDLIKGEWDAPHEIHQTHLPGLEKVERELLLAVLDQWIELLLSEEQDPK